MLFRIIQKIYEIIFYLMFIYGCVYAVEFLMGRKTGWLIEKLFGPKTQEERDALARRYGEEGSKHMMEINMKRRGKRALIYLGLSFTWILVLHEVGFYIFMVLALLSIFSIFHESAFDKAKGLDIETLYRVNFIEPALAKVFPEGFTYNHEQYLQDENLMAALPDRRKMSVKDFMKGKDLITFNYHGIPIRSSHNSCSVPDGTDSDGGVEYRTVFDGQIYETNYRTRINGYVRIVPTVTFLGRENTGDYRGQIKNTEIKVETDNIYFNEHFDVFATSQQDALFVLNPIVINFFTNYRQEHGKMAMYVSGDTLVITKSNVAYHVFDTPMGLNDVSSLSVQEKCLKFTKMADSCLEMLQAINGRNV